MTDGSGSAMGQSHVVDGDCGEEGDGDENGDHLVASCLFLPLSMRKASATVLEIVK